MKVYHLHLPRTSGVFLRNQLKLSNAITGHKLKIDPEDFKKVDYAFGHYGSYPIQYADYSFCIFREPVERTISYFKYIKQHYYTAIDVIELIDLYINDYRLVESVSNLSNKFLTGIINFDLYNRDIRYPRMMVENGWHLNSYATDLQSSISRIKESGIDILYFDKNLYDKISDIYKIKIDKLATKTNSSIEYDIPKSYYNKIADLNEIDMELYEYFKK
jgi:hypothetical protein